MYMYLAVERGKCFTLSQSVFLRELMMRRGLESTGIANDDTPVTMPHN